MHFRVFPSDAVTVDQVVTNPNLCIVATPLVAQGHHLMSQLQPFFTVFTPTYNRAHTLHRVYESLLAQTFRDVEWVVVDDGSNDNTAALIREWQSNPETWFPIRYFWQENQHKKVAFNHGAEVARGQLFLCADSDDRFPENALERFALHWNAIPEAERERFAGISGLCVYEDGRLVGDRFPCAEWIDSDFLEIRYRYRVSGEKWGFAKTELHRLFKFPEDVPGHVPENVVWSRIASQYKIRFINEVVRVYIQEPSEGSSQITHSGNPKRVAPGMVVWKRMVLSEEIHWFRYAPVSFLLDAARLVRFGAHCNGRKGSGFWPKGWRGRLLVAVMAPVGGLWWIL